MAVFFFKRSSCGRFFLGERDLSPFYLAVCLVRLDALVGVCSRGIRVQLGFLCGLEDVLLGRLDSLGLAQNYWLGRLCHRESTCEHFRRQSFVFGIGHTTVRCDEGAHSFLALLR